MLKINKIDAGYGGIRALKNVSLEVGDGELVALIGANGAGKSTLLNTISGMVPLRSGTIEYNGVKISSLAPHKIVQMGVIQIPEGRLVFAGMSVKENLEVGCYLRHDKKEIAEAYEQVYNLFPILKERNKQMAGTLSGGEQQMMAIARGLMSKPSILLMDEPSLGLSPVLVEHVAETIDHIRKQKIAILLVEQNARMALRLADRGYVLQVGEMVMTGTGKELLRHPDVRKAYLGI
ncbi:MAG: ABC transporter ATP-binding protein [Dehalococcoidales bacterium]|nr:ABC transporter ATP-binding protein [Dehalococcoidales bacterium]